MNKELKEQTHKEFDERFPENKPIIGGKIMKVYLNESLKSFIDSLIDKTVQMTEERIRKDVVNHFNNTEVFYGNPRTEKMIYYDDALELISLFTEQELEHAEKMELELKKKQK